MGHSNAPIEFSKGPAADHAAERLFDAAGELALQIHELFLQERIAAPLGIVVEPYDPLTAVWTGCGQTAGVVLWIRESRLLAATIIASGLDPREDARAIAMATRATRSKTSRQLTRGQLAVTKRPLLINLPVPGTGNADPVIATASVAWAAAFFGMLGVGGRMVRPSHRPVAIEPDASATKHVDTLATSTCGDFRCERPMRRDGIGRLGCLLLWTMVLVVLALLFL